jgi:hypothetical protein
VGVFTADFTAPLEWLGQPVRLSAGVLSPLGGALPITSAIGRRLLDVNCLDHQLFLSSLNVHRCLAADLLVMVTTDLVR